LIKGFFLMKILILQLMFWSWLHTQRWWILLSPV